MLCSQIDILAGYYHMTEDITLTTDEKIAIIHDLMQEIHSKSGILAIHSQDFLTGRPVPSPLHTYQILGSDFTRRTQTSNLQQKVMQAQQTALRVEQENQKMEKEEEEQEDEIDKEGYRYYKNNVRCFRCKKIGHHNYACPRQTQCIYCLSTSHQTQKCPQRTVCYQCYEWGHMISECPSAPGYFCQNCKRRHTRNCSFLTRGTEPIKHLFSRDYLASDPEIRCMRCLNYGHLICEDEANDQ